MRHPKGHLTQSFSDITAKACETCMQAVHLETELELSEDPQKPSTVQAFVRTTNGRKELVLSQ